MTAKLVHDNGGQRFYKLSSTITKGYYTGTSDHKDIMKELNDFKKYLKPEYSHIYDGMSGADIICISDAHTHIERLAFVAIEVNGEFARTKVQIDGANTMMIHGGDERKVKPDAVYLRRLASINGFYFDQFNN